MEIESTPMLCPRDATPLEERQWQRFAYQLCVRCHGIRIEAEELETLMREPIGLALVPPGAAECGEIVEGTALCGCAGQPLMKRTSVDGLILDVCPSCGAMWFDAGEIQAFLDRNHRRSVAGAAESISGSSSQSSTGEALLKIFDAIFDVLDLLSVF